MLGFLALLGSLGVLAVRILRPMSEAVVPENVASDLEALEARILTVRDSL